MTDQVTFQAGLLHPDQDIPPGVLDGHGRPAGRRYDVYRNNVTVSLIEALKTGFPLVLNLIGGQNFDRLAQTFVRKHPPTSPLMMFYGTRFPDFLHDFQPLAQIGYLRDAASLDLSMRHSYHAADAAPFDPISLQDLPADTLMHTTFALAPSTIILRSKWPLFDIWRFNVEPEAPKPQPVAQDVLITRPSLDPRPHALPAGAATWFEALQKGAALADATEMATAQTPDFDLAACLTFAFDTQAFACPETDKEIS